MNKLELASNNLQWLICHKTKPNPAVHNMCSCLSYLDGL